MTLQLNIDHGNAQGAIRSTGVARTTRWVAAGDFSAGSEAV